MPRNYDEIRNGREDDTFVIRGETFKLRAVPYTVLDEIEALQTDYLKQDLTSYKVTFDFSMSRLLMLLDDTDGAAERLKALCERKDDPVTYGELLDLSKWALERATGLPTMPPAASPASPAGTARTSKGG